MKFAFYNRPQRNRGLIFPSFLTQINFVRKYSENRAYLSQNDELVLIGVLDTEDTINTRNILRAYDRNVDQVSVIVMDEKQSIRINAGYIFEHFGAFDFRKEYL